MRTILHVDLDAFFASAELTRHPEWRGRPVIVGSPPDGRGVVSTCSYEARRYGVRSAMPSRTAWRLCPHAVFTRPDIAFYREISRKAFGVFARHSPFVEAVSVDEAFLDITGTIHLYGGAEKLGEALREKVLRECGVTCSVGIARNRLLAKIGSELAKPDGLFTMPSDPAEIARFLAPKPVGILWGVGRKTAGILAKYGIATCRDLQNAPARQLETILGKAAASSLKNHALGISSDRVARDEDGEKSVSREHTFVCDETDRENVRSTLLELAADVGRSVRKEARWAATARIKLRDADFETVSRQTSLPAPSRDDRSFRDAALALFDGLWPESGKGLAVRLVGFGVSNFKASPGAEPSLFRDEEDAERERREKLSEAIDLLKGKGLNVGTGTAIAHRPNSTVAGTGESTSILPPSILT
ncbi:MAG: DNA polymerase IV [Kiritimatiellae bacterium]|nr:DNA polymerase IV [Kiritimatiellia bacterium]